MGPLVSQLYYIKTTQHHRPPKRFGFIKKVHLWRAQLAHVNSTRFVNMARREVVAGTPILQGDKLVKCESYITGKACRANILKEQTTSSSRDKLLLVHSDVCGHIESHSPGGAIYFVTFTDDYSRCAVFYPIKNKPDVIFCICNFRQYAETKTECGMCALQTDRGGRYLSKRSPTI